MPGIVGLVTKKSPAQARTEVERMLDPLRHESFYKAGTYCDESLGLYVGWTALENSFSDGMPVCNEQGNVVLIFSGEEYPEPGTTSNLKERGHAFSAEGPSYLVHLYEEEPDFLLKLNGRFHGIVADRTRGITLFNDRYGMHRIYFHEAKDAFYFSAEAKAILAVRPELRKADTQGIGELISFGAVLQDRTLFQGIRLLPASSAWTFANSSLQKKETYFQPCEWENQTPLDSDSYYQNLRGAFSQNLPRYFNSREPLGVALTGGMDTRVIMAWKKAPPESLPCYTFGGTYRDCRDVLLARKVAAICGQSHQVVPLGKGFLSRFAHYAERSVYLTDGCVDVGRAQDLYLSEKARQIAPVKVVGTYGSEVVRHARMFKPVDPAPGLFTNEVLPFVEQARDTYQELIKEHPATFAAFRQSPWWHHGILALEQTQITVRSPYLDNRFVQAIYRAPKTTIDDMDVRLRLIADGNPELGRLPSDRGVGGNSNFLSAALNRAYLEFTFKAEYAYDYGMPQWVAQTDHLFAPLHLERIWLGRHKFAHYRVWYRDFLGAYVKEILLDPRTLARPYLQRKGVESVVNGHLKGNRNYTLEIHRLLSLELLQRLFFDAR
jgi:asparagine synthase (glutamine-hydrolysing)